MNRTCCCFCLSQEYQQLAIDSPWTLKLKHNDAKIRAEIPLLTEQDERY